jgi:hypothetical protein
MLANPELLRTGHQRFARFKPLWLAVSDDEIEQKQYRILLEEIEAELDRICNGRVAADD